MILLSWQAQEYEDNTGEGDRGAGGQCYLIAAHERGAGSMREQGAGTAPTANRPDRTVKKIFINPNELGVRGPSSSSRACQAR